MHSRVGVARAGTHEQSFRRVEGADVRLLDEERHGREHVRRGGIHALARRRRDGAAQALREAVGAAHHPCVATAACSRSSRERPVFYALLGGRACS